MEDGLKLRKTLPPRGTSGPIHVDCADCAGPQQEADGEQPVQEHGVQATLLGLGIAIILALVAALVGPHFIDWTQYRSVFETQVSRFVGMPGREAGAK